MNKIIHGDCIEKLKELPDSSIDSIVTDPPYHLVSIVKRFGKEGSAPAQFGTDGAFSRASKGFMGKTWDGLGEDGIGIANNPSMWAECLRVLKPGGHLLAFSGTRNYHRMASAIEDAGFEVRDMIEWVYGSGFPKSLNIGKAVDKLQGKDREFIGTISSQDITSGGLVHKEYSRVNVSVTKGTSEWEGWGTALKPAHEPICMARKPLAEKTVALNVLKYGTSGINIDESRVGMSQEDKEMIDAKASTNNNGVNFDVGEGKAKGTATPANNLGRFPANLIHDNSEEVRECFPETTTNGVKTPFVGGASKGINLGGGNVKPYETNSGNASRFFKGIPQVVDLHDFSIYNRSILTNIKQLCGQHLTKKKTDITLDGVIQEVEKFIQDAELLMSGNSTTIEKFLTDTAFITKTLIAQMTELKTLNVLPNWFIMKFTEESEKTISSLKELNTEDVKSAKSIFLLQIFISEVLESIRAIAEIVAEQDSNNGDYKSLTYQAKASKSERNKGCEELEEKRSGSMVGNINDANFLTGSGNKREGKNRNNHPTVKPIALMEYLIKMVTPKNGTVLDPFAGSGSTGVACNNLNLGYILIEKEADYVEIIKKRLGL